MQTYRFIEKVIDSCVNFEQLGTCLTWIHSLNVQPHLKEAAITHLRLKLKELSDW